MPSLQLDPVRILEIFYPYVAINSETATPNENKASNFIHQHFLQNPYFQSHTDLLGLHTIENDPYQRQVAWALVKGQGNKTAVMIHHFDVVEIEDFKMHRQNAFSPEALTEALLQTPDALSEEAYQDLKSGDWIFGRGTADMKAGGAVQMALIEAHSQQESFQGNLLLLAVPDEENLSAGMRAAAPLLTKLRTKHALNYVLMINSEPHQRKTPETGMLSGGSIGKMLPFVYVRGILAHAGKSPEGFNPVQILSEIICRTEMNPGMTDFRPEAGEMSPPPTWLMARDSKVVYDVSMPLSAFGCLSVLQLSNTPQKISDYLFKTTKNAAAEVAARVNQAADLFHKNTHRPIRSRQWQPETITFSELLKKCVSQHGKSFQTYYNETLKLANQNLREGKATNASATWNLLDAIFEYTGCEQPTVVIGVVPPYYPSVSYLDRPEYSDTILKLTSTLNAYTKENYNQRYDLEAYFTGISDLSYSSLKTQEINALEASIADQMPLYGAFYAIPFNEIAENAMPCINIGPWGKDFHKISERVLKEDMLIRTPAMIIKALEEVLK
jgi:arginine utilization protein RocB